MRVNVKMLFVLILMSLNIMANAQSADTLKVSVEQAMAYATKHGYQSKNAQTDIEIAKKRVRETLAIGLPHVNASADLSKYLKVPKTVVPAIIFDPNAKEGDVAEVEFAQPYNINAGVNVSQLLFDGSYFVGLQASKIYVKLSENIKEKTDIEMKQAVAQAYFLTIMAKENSREFEKSLATNKKILNQTKAYFENGLIEDIDVDQIQLMVNESERYYLNSINQYKTAKSLLKFLMGYDISLPLELTEDMSNLIEQIQTKEISSKGIESHILYRSIMTSIDIQKLSIKNQKAMAMPKLSAFFNYSYSMSGQDLGNLVDYDAPMVGLSLNVPIFSSGMRSSQLKQKKLELNKLNYDKLQTEQNLKHGLFVAKSNLNNAQKAYDNTKLSKKIANRVYDKSSIKFENGITSSLELSQIQNNTIEAIMNFYNASYQYYNEYLLYLKANSQL